MKTVAFVDNVLRFDQISLTNENNRMRRKIEIDNRKKQLQCNEIK